MRNDEIGEMVRKCVRLNRLKGRRDIWLILLPKQQLIVVRASANTVFMEGATPILMSVTVVNNFTTFNDITVPTQYISLSYKMDALIKCVITASRRQCCAVNVCYGSISSDTENKNSDVFFFPSSCFVHPTM